LTATQHPDSSAALVLFSGGQDSSISLAWALERYQRVETVAFDYGQRHSVELEARAVVRRELARQFPGLASHLGEDAIVDLGGLGAVSETALTRQAEILIGENGLPTTFVPGRNLVFLTMAAALAYRRGLGVLVAGMCETDFSGYPDCRREALDAQMRAIELGMEAKFTLETPLMHLSKAQSWSLAEEIGGDDLVELLVEHTHSCYRGDRARRFDWGYGCGACPACELRANGWSDYVAAKSGRKQG
jgi:7-cyano-7-deazaguanine synthase